MTFTFLRGLWFIACLARIAGIVSGCFWEQKGTTFANAMILVSLSMVSLATPMASLCLWSPRCPGVFKRNWVSLKFGVCWNHYTRKWVFYTVRQASLLDLVSTCQCFRRARLKGLRSWRLWCYLSQAALALDTPIAASDLSRRRRPDCADRMVR